jgi:hypothetical protein
MSTPAYDALASLRKLIAVERENEKEKLALGHGTPEDRLERVGRCKALKWAVDKISEQIKSVNQGADNADD